MPQTETGTRAHVPGDVNHKFMGAAGYDFCHVCGVTLRGKRTVLETEMLEALEQVYIHAYDPEYSIERERAWGKVKAVICKAKGEV